MGKSSFHEESGVNSQRANNGQKKTECGSAFSAVHADILGELLNRVDGKTAFRCDDLRAQCPQAIDSSPVILAGIRANDLGGIIRKGSAD